MNRLIESEQEPRTAPAIEESDSWRAGALAGRRPPVCREMVRTLLHGHRYDGSRAERELGLRYTEPRETIRKTVAWARAEGLIR